MKILKNLINGWIIRINFEEEMEQFEPFKVYDHNGKWI